MSERRSILALNSANFFLAQIASVVIPFLNVYLRQHGWRYDQIGMAMATAGLGSLIFQIPAGLTCDHVEHPRKLLAASALWLGLCYSLIPMFVGNTPRVATILFLSGIPGTFFAPLLASLANSVAGRGKLHLVLGENQSWNHAGNVASALLALVVVRVSGIPPLFYAAALMAFLAALSSFMIRPAQPTGGEEMAASFDWATVRSFASKARQLMQDKDVRTLLICITLFQVANGSLGSLVTLYMKELGSSDSKIAWILLVAQPIMIPAAWLAGRYAHLGRKRLLGLAFVLLPLRLLLYAFASTPNMVLAITALDGIIAGIVGVVLVLICSDLARGKKVLNSLMGLVHTAPALGAVAGVALQGMFTESFGFAATFSVFAAVATAAAGIFLARMPETYSEPEQSLTGA